MNSDHMIGTHGIRGAAVVLSAVCVGAVGLELAGMVSERHAALRLAEWVAGLLALLAGVHWSPRTYRRWMQAAGVMNVVMTTLLLGVCYFVIVPVFWAIVQLRRLGRTKRGRESSWHERPVVEHDHRFFQRMG